MKTTIKYPHEFRIPASQEFTRSIKDPYHLGVSDSAGISFIHSLVKVRHFPSGQIPDDVNPRSHEVIRMRSKIPSAIETTLVEDPKHFHLLNRGCLIVAKKAWYNNRTKMLHFIIESKDDHGMVDGATTDRVLARLKDNVLEADFETLEEAEVPEYFKQAYLHLEIVSGDIDQDLRIKLADARNTSMQVKEFSLEDLGGGFQWLKDIIESSRFKGKIRYRENEPNPVDIRTVLALLTLFHPYWLEKNRDPIVAYTGKGSVLKMYTDLEHRDGYKRLSPLVLDILALFDEIHVGFEHAYKSANATNGKGSKFGRRKEVKYIPSTAKPKTLDLTGMQTSYVVPDGWLYPVIGSLRMLVDWPSNAEVEVRWVTDPFKFFAENGPELVSMLVEKSEELGRNPNATGKSKGVWQGLRDRVANHLLIMENDLLKAKLSESSST